MEEKQEQEQTSPEPSATSDILDAVKELTTTTASLAQKIETLIKEQQTLSKNIELKVKAGRF
jgi:hypothetical protein